MKKGDDFVIWSADGGGKYCTLEGLLEVDDVFQIKEGSPRAQGFPEDARFNMNRQAPKEVALADSLSNYENMVVVSKPLREHLEQKAPPSVEYLPVSVYNHKRRLASADYCIVNPLAIVRGQLHDPSAGSHLAARADDHAGRVIEDQAGPDLRPAQRLQPDLGHVPRL